MEAINFRTEFGQVLKHQFSRSLNTLPVAEDLMYKVYR